MSRKLQIVTFIFHTGPGIKKALVEFEWTLKQSPEFWKMAVLYTDPECDAMLDPYRSQLGDIIVDSSLPEPVQRNKKWTVKGWWAKCGVERFGRILQCDFDLFVRKLPDEKIDAMLDTAPRFLNIPSYTNPVKIVGCGCSYYDETCDWDSFLRVLYERHHHDEKAWTAALNVSRDDFLASGMHMDPHIVDQGWVMENPYLLDQVYIVHGISQYDDGRRLLRKMGYSEKEIHWACRPHEELIYRVGNLKRWFQGKSDPSTW